MADEIFLSWKGSLSSSLESKNIMDLAIVPEDIHYVECKTQ